MQKQQFHIPNMACSGCAGAIRASLEHQQGVSEVTTDVQAKTVEVSLDGTGINLEDVRQVLEEAGYPAQD